MNNMEKLWRIFCVAIGNYRSAESTLILESGANTQYNLNKLDEEVSKMADEFEETLKQVKMEMEKGQWIPCSSGKMPENGQTVVVTIRSTDAYRFMVVLTYHETKPKCFTDNDWQGEGFYHYIWGDWVKRENVIAWMPAEPYKGVE